MAAITWQKYLDDHRDATDRRKKQCEKDSLDPDTERTKSHYTKLTTLEQRDRDITDKENEKVFKELMTKWRRVGLEDKDEADTRRYYSEENFFRDVTDILEIGEKVAEGGQANIHLASIESCGCILKVFNPGYSLKGLQKYWPEALLAAKSRPYKYSPGSSTDEDLKMGAFREGCCRVWCGTLLKGPKDFAGRFAFLMDMHWGDLRTLIDLQMSDENLDLPPFEDSLAISFILQIAKGMQSLHALHVIHRDLKASNVLMLATGLIAYGIEHERTTGYHDSMCRIADYESSANIDGTPCWMAPEVLDASLQREPGKSLPRRYFTSSSDVYSYGLTCYEVLTGILISNIKFADHVALMRSGGLPFPEYVPGDLRELLKKCWDSNPSERPSFEDIVARLEEIQKVHGQKKELSAEQLKRISTFRKKHLQYDITYK